MSVSLSSDRSIGSQRIASLDAFRGLVVFVWIFSEIVVPALYRLPANSVTEALAVQLSPSFWHGATVRDLLVPLFCFIAGASIEMAFNRRRQARQSNRDLALRIARRVLLLFAIGLLCEGSLLDCGLGLRLSHLRLVGAYQRIAVCYAVAACLELAAGWRVQAGLLVFLLINFWLILEFGSGPNGGGPFSLEGNVAAAVDRLLLPGRKYFATWDPNGILTTIPAIAVTIAGLLAGKMLAREPFANDKGTLWFACLGIAAVNLAFLWALVLPINAYLWTPSFCLVVIGAGFLLLAAFQAVLDVRRMPSWAVSLEAPALALGRNSLLVILGAVLVERGIVVLGSRLPLVESLFPEGIASPPCGIPIAFFVIVVALWLDRRGRSITV
jgi:predicted acyltransferase